MGERRISSSVRSRPSRYVGRREGGVISQGTPSSLSSPHSSSHVQMMMKKQDEGLEMLGQSAARLGELSMNIHEEIGHQNK